MTSIDSANEVATSAWPTTKRKGRLPLGKVRVQLTFRPATNRLIEKRSVEAGITKSEYVERLITSELYGTPEREVKSKMNHHLTALDVTKPDYDMSAYLSATLPTKAAAQKRAGELRKSGRYLYIKIDGEEAR